MLVITLPRQAGFKAMATVKGMGDSNAAMVMAGFMDVNSTHKKENNKTLW